MGNLRIDKIIYSGKNYFFESKYFEKNLILVEGDNGTGKTTLCDLIYFGLGGKVNQFQRESDKRHQEVASDLDNFVELYIKINNKGYSLRRYISENDITITPYVNVPKEKTDTQKAEPFNPIFDTQNTFIRKIFRNDNEEIFSDWILKNLGISVVELFQGYKSFKINFTDLMRLIYHDQQPNPEGIYKKIDIKGNFVSDSELLRKAIFELLVGKSFSDYYDSISSEKKAEKEKQVAKSMLDEYENLSSKIRKTSEIKNKSFLQTELQEKEFRLEKLQAGREQFKRNRNNSVHSNTEIETYKNKIISLELLISDEQEKLIQLYNERYKLVHLKDQTDKEAIQIQKVIHTHNQLNLFSSETCPYCLSKVERASGHCVCGASIEEEQYERFFYTSQEYNQILKSKLKERKTIELALSGYNDEIDSIKQSIKSANNELPTLKGQLSKYLDQIDQKIDLETINDIDDTILFVRQEIAEILQAIEIETKLEKFQKEYDSKRELHRELELKRKQLEIDAQKDIENKVKKFSEIYNELMKSTLADCRSARIDNDNYMPTINDGFYREASSLVPIRLMYYLTLMRLSLTEKDVAFPRFLLIDTPETAGIELENLKMCISKFQELELQSNDYQIILATGLGKYPETLKENRVLFMPNKSERLLLPRD